MRLEQARYEVERAERQYNVVEPENRLVVRTLEQRWEAALAAEVKLREEHTRFLARQPARLSAADRETIRRLSQDVPALWQADSTTAAERKEIVRLLLERVEVTIQNDSERAEVVCVWAGGQRARYELIRSVRRTSQLTHHGALLDRIRALHRDGVRAPAISRTLTAEGWRSAHGKTFTEGSVRALMTRMGLPPAWMTRPSTIMARADGEFTVAEIAGRLNLPEGTVYAWLYKHRLPARRVEVADRSLWLIRLEDVQKLLRSRGTSGRLPPVTSP
ncbi:MAG: hypothetical protein NVS2B7_22840 [Herpetosiphon sp.]